MISAVILSKNNQKTLGEVLLSLTQFDEVILFDTGSQDSTLEIAKKFPNVKIFHSTLTSGFGPVRNLAAAHAKNDWILSIDSDEVLSEDLSKEILNLRLDEKNVYSLPFHNFYNKKWIKWCGWYPEEHVRLYNRKSTQFSIALVHEGVEVTTHQIQKLRYPVYHTPYHCVADFLFKMQIYSDLFAKQYQGKRHSSPIIALFHGLCAFLKSYILKRGFLGGYAGFLISLYNANTALYKYLKLYEINKKSETP